MLLAQLVVLSLGTALWGGCVSGGVLQGPETLPPGQSAFGVKVARHGGSAQAVLTYRAGVLPSADVGVDLGLSMVRVDPKVRILEGPLSVAIALPVSYNLSLRDISYGDDYKKWILNGIPGAHPAFIVGFHRLYVAASGSYYHTRSGWNPAGTSQSLIAPRWFSYGVTVGYQSAFSGPDSTRLVAEVGYLHFPGWRSFVVPSLSLQFSL